MDSFSDQEYVQFLTMFDESGVYTKSIFFQSKSFNQLFRVMKIDKEAVESVTKLSSFYAQLRSIGVKQ